jgi:hypothetical protein
LLSSGNVKNILMEFAQPFEEEKMDTIYLLVQNGYRVKWIGNNFGSDREQLRQKVQKALDDTDNPDLRSLLTRKEMGGPHANFWFTLD